MLRVVLSGQSLLAISVRWLDDPLGVETRGALFGKKSHPLLHDPAPPSLPSSPSLFPFLSPSIVIATALEAVVLKVLFSIRFNGFR
jgi:hypothetical protein